MPKIVEKDLSYKIVGVLFEVHTDLGNGYQEKYYQRAVAVALNKAGLKYSRELTTKLNFKGVNIGHYRLDFLVESRVVLEIKAVPEFDTVDFKQVSAYLKAAKLELGILTNFRPSSLIYKRVLNSDFIRSKNLGKLE